MSRRLKKALVLCLALLVLTGCRRPEPEPEPPPVETGYRATGRGNPNVPANSYAQECFQSAEGFMVYTGDDAPSHIGVDVSSHQGEIDWPAVRQSGVEFAMIRVGFRGYSTGNINPDACFEANIRGALDAGLQVGVYFFSQAVTPEEAAEEARAVLEWIAPYELDYPVVYDWENIAGDEARTDNLDPETVTLCADAFCAAVEAAGYRPMLYANRHQTYEIIDLEQLGAYDFWLASYEAAPSFEYRFQMWQYGTSREVPGISTEVDLDLCLTDYPAAPPEGAGPEEGGPGEAAPEESA